MPGRSVVPLSPPASKKRQKLLRIWKAIKHLNNMPTGKRGAIQEKSPNNNEARNIVVDFAKDKVDTRRPGRLEGMKGLPPVGDDPCATSWTGLASLPALTSSEFACSGMAAKRCWRVRNVRHRKSGGSHDMVAQSLFSRCLLSRCSGNGLKLKTLLCKRMLP